MSIQLPSSFVTLRARGAFDYWGGRSYAELSKEERGRIAAERRYLGLWLKDLEWTADDVTEDPNLRPGLFPFAQNGAGDQYAFFPQWPGRGEEASILFAPHDEMTAKVFATSFSELLLHKWLETARWWDENYDGSDRLEVFPSALADGVSRSLIDAVGPRRATTTTMAIAT